jgi:pimeloyl-ACP methyl ester carboxylesterase
VLLLVHAFPVGVRLFEPQWDAFPGWRIVAPALPGFDGSELLERASVDEHAGQVLALLDHLRVDRVVAGGVSLGGYVIFGLLRRAAERVAALVLADTRSSADTPEARAGRDRLLQDVRQSGPAAVAAEMLPKLLGQTSHRSRPALVSGVRRMIAGQSTAGLAAAIQVLMSRPDSTPLLAGIRVPALVVAGNEDVLTPPSEMTQLAAAIPDAMYVQIDDAGHLSNLENPGAFNHAVAGWLASHVRSVRL